ncbi:unnamed protein product [Jaminaea pallidilutea]
MTSNSPAAHQEHRQHIDSNHSGHSSDENITLDRPRRAQHYTSTRAHKDINSLCPALPCSAPSHWLLYLRGRTLQCKSWHSAPGKQRQRARSHQYPQSSGSHATPILPSGSSFYSLVDRNHCSPISSLPQLSSLGPEFQSPRSAHRAPSATLSYLVS